MLRPPRWRDFAEATRQTEPRNALTRLDPSTAYDSESDTSGTIVDGSLVGGVLDTLEPWDGRGGIAPWGGKNATQAPEIKNSRDPSVVRPPLYDKYVHPLGFSWPALFLDHHLEDGDLIQATITHNAVDRGHVEFVLEAGPDVHWWKAIRQPDDQGNSVLIETENDVRSASTTLQADQVHGGQALIFHKAKFLGAKRIVYRLGDLDRLPPGSRATFRWTKD